MMEVVKIVALVALGLVVLPWLLKLFFTMLGLTVTFVAISIKLAILGGVCYVLFRAFKALSSGKSR